jgi:hypothetical protein
LQSPVDNNAQLDKRRDSATSGNGIGIVQTAHTSGKPTTSLKSKQNLATETVVNLEDEDDTVERESILQSLPKGAKRLSSAVSCFIWNIYFA